MSRRTTLLCILDGFGLNPNPAGNAVALARKPVLDQLFNSSPTGTLTTYGEIVGLPKGQMGNSEVGHLTIGAGRTVPQWLTRISSDLSGIEIWRNAALSNLLKSVEQSSTLHLIGLCSDGGVHSHIEHLLLLIQGIRKQFAGKITLHLITDGRDTGPNSGVGYINKVEKAISPMANVSIATVIGRFYAMDRDRRWERTSKAAELFISGAGTHAASPEEWLKGCYDKGITDEFIEPAVINQSPIVSGDGVIFWNFRADRMRQIVRAISEVASTTDDFTPQLPRVAASHTLCFADYDTGFKLPFLFSEIEVANHLGQVLANAGLKQLRVAETEKYAHVTYFFNGGVEIPYAGEERQLVPSPRDVKTYDLKPEMSAIPVTEIVVRGIESKKFDLIVVNLANCDMVGHTGVLEAGIKAVETVDLCLGKMISALEAANGQAVIIADHGNVEQMINYEDGTPHTSHTTYPVPIIVYGDPQITAIRSGGSLRDIAPTILALMNQPLPSEMKGSSLLVHD